jgi:hypothetical protein
MKLFEEPKLEIKAFEVEDIMTESSIEDETDHDNGFVDIGDLLNLFGL